MAKKKEVGIPMMVVQSKMKEHLKARGMMCSGDLADEVNRRIAGLLDDAACRTKSNNRSTVRAADV